MRAKVVLDDVGARENGAKMWVVQKYSLTHSTIFFSRGHLWTRRSCWVGGIVFKVVAKTWAYKKNSFYKFSQLPIIKYLTWFTLPYD